MRGWFLISLFKELRANRRSSPRFSDTEGTAQEGCHGMSARAAALNGKGANLGFEAQLFLAATSCGRAWTGICGVLGNIPLSNVSYVTLLG